MNISEFQKNEHFHILKFRDHLDVIPMKVDSRQCEFFQIVITKDHNVDVVVDNVRFSAMDESITFMAPLQLLSTEVNSVEDLGVSYMLVFSNKFLRPGFTHFEIFQKFPFFNINHSPIYLLNKNQELFFNLMETIYNLFQDYNEENVEIIRSYLTILLFEGRKSFLDGTIINSASSRYDEISFAFENLIKETENKRSPLDHYARKLNISTIYLSECVKKSTGKTAKQILTDSIILEATSLLLHSTKNMNEIADAIGYTSISNFAVFFKKQTGYTPSQYRKTFR